MAEVAAQSWLASLAEAAREGLDYLDFLTAIDRGEHLQVVARVVDLRSMEARLYTTVVPAADAMLDSIVDLHAGAGWHERETAELFGVTFVGNPDLRPLVTRGGVPPLLKSTPLPARVTTPWPGSDPSARRRARTPGVPDEWQGT